MDVMSVMHFLTNIVDHSNQFKTCLKEITQFGLNLNLSFSLES